MLGMQYVSINHSNLLLSGTKKTWLMIFRTCHTFVLNAVKKNRSRLTDSGELAGYVKAWHWKGYTTHTVNHTTVVHTLCQ